MSYVRVYEVTDVDVVLLKSSPPSLAIAASGQVNSTGWSDAHLSQWIYITPPSDHILDLDFVAKKPTGMVLWRISPVHADSIIESIDVENYWGHGGALAGIRVHAGTNTREVTIGSDLPTAKAALAVGDRWPW